MAGQTMWFAFVLRGEPESSQRGPGGYVREVVVINDDSPDGEKIVKYVEGGRCTTIGGPFCSGRLFDTEAEGWAFCAKQLRAQAAAFDRAAAECETKAGVEVPA